MGRGLAVRVPPGARARRLSSREVRACGIASRLSRALRHRRLMRERNLEHRREAQPPAPRAPREAFRIGGVYRERLIWWRLEGGAPLHPSRPGAPLRLSSHQPTGRIEAPSPRHSSVADRPYLDTLGLVQTGRPLTLRQGLGRSLNVRGLLVSTGATSCATSLTDTKAKTSRSTGSDVHQVSPMCRRSVSSGCRCWWSGRTLSRRGRLPETR